MDKKAMERRLEELRADERTIEQERYAIYKASLEAAEDEKLCPDWMAKQLSGPSPFKKIEYPVTVNGISHKEGDRALMPSPGRQDTKWVKIRSVKEKHGKKTYLGVLLGDIALGVGCWLTPDGILSLEMAHHNPAIYVPDLHEVIFGAESWWGPIESPDDLREITDATIDNVWYVRALKDLGSEDQLEAAAKGMVEERKGTQAQRGALGLGRETADELWNQSALVRTHPQEVIDGFKERVAERKREADGE